MTAKDEFRKSLAEELVKAGRKNTEISLPGDAGRKEAMENLAEAFADPVGEYVEKEMAMASAGLRSSGTSTDCRVAFSAVSKAENTSDGCTLTFTAIDGTKKAVKVRNVARAGNADTVGGYHIVVGSTGTDSKTIYFTKVWTGRCHPLGWHGNAHEKNTCILK